MSIDRLLALRPTVKKKNPRQTASTVEKQGMRKKAATAKGDARELVAELRGGDEGGHADVDGGMGSDRATRAVTPGFGSGLAAGLRVGFESRTMSTRGAPGSRPTSQQQRQRQIAWRGVLDGGISGGGVNGSDRAGGGEEPHATTTGMGGISGLGKMGTEGGGGAGEREMEDGDGRGSGHAPEAGRCAFEVEGRSQNPFRRKRLEALYDTWKEEEEQEEEQEPSEITSRALKARLALALRLVF
eukprot:jgi/Undpi1/4742/HiC_scaffold_18.g08095.m1